MMAANDGHRMRAELDSYAIATTTSPLSFMCFFPPPSLTRFVKEKRPTISPNFNFLGQLLDFEKKIKSSPHGAEAKLKSLHQSEPIGEASAQHEGPDGAQEAPISQDTPGPQDLAMLEPLTLPCVLAGVPEERLLAQALSGLQLTEGAEENARLKRSFSLDIKSYGEPGGNTPHRTFVPHAGPGDTAEYYKPSSFKEPASKPCQFSPVEEVSEQSTPEQSPDKEQVDGPASVTTPAASNSISMSTSTTNTKQPNTAKPQPPPPPSQCSHQLHRSGSMEESTHTTSFLFGLSRSQQHLAKPGGTGGALKGWHSDILLGPVTVSTSSLAGGWYLSSESTRFYSTSAILSGGGFAAYSCSQGFEAVRRRGRQRSGDRGDSRRSWHEESTFEKQLKRRSCQMEFGDGMSESRSREEMGKVGSQSSFSGSMEIIEVS